MKILQVYPYFAPAWSYGGVTRVIYEISKCLVDRGHDVSIYTTDAFDNKSRVQIKSNPTYVNGIKSYYFRNLSNYLTYKYHLPFPLEMLFRIKKEIKNFSIIHLQGYRHWLNRIAYLHAKKYRIPYILQAHGSLSTSLTKTGLKLLYDRLFGYKILKNASKVIALGRYEAEQYRCFDVHDEKVEIIPNGIDLTKYVDLPPKGSFKEKFNIPSDKKIILYVGRIHKSKGIDFLVKAYGYLTKNMTFNDAILVIVGPDDGYLTEIKLLASSLGLLNKIVFTGFISNQDTLKAFVDGEVFVTPSFYGFPMTFLESCAVGTPLITTTMGDILGWIDNNVGYVTPPIIRGLAEAIHKVISNDKTRDKFSRNCSEIVKTEFSLDKVVDKLENMYRETAGD